jgi:MFS family permease
MLVNLFVTLFLLLCSTFILKKLFNLPRNVYLLFMAQPLIASSSPIIVFIGGILASQLVTDPSIATLPLTLLILGVTIASIPAALLAKFKGRKFAIYVGLSLFLLASSLAMFSAIYASFALFCIASLLFGFGLAFSQQLRFAAIESTKKTDDIPTTVSILMLSGVFAAFLGPEVAVVAKDWVASPFGYAGSFFLLGILIVLAMLIMSAYKNTEIPEIEVKGTPRSLALIMKQPIFLISVIVATLGYGLMSFLMTATPLSMHNMQGHSLVETKWVIQTHIAAMYIPSLFSVFLIKKIGYKGLMLLGSLLYSLVAIIAFSGQEVLHYWWALLLLGIGWNFLFLTGTSLLPQSYQSHERHKVQAANDFILFAFQAIASLMAGWLLFKAGWTIVVISSLPFITALFVVTFYYIRMANKKSLVSKKI